jgi:hypothetical protein
VSKMRYIELKQQVGRQPGKFRAWTFLRSFGEKFVCVGSYPATISKCKFGCFILKPYILSRSQNLIALSRAVNRR